MREIIGEKTEFNKIFNYFLKLLDIVGPPAHTQYVVFSTWNCRALNVNVTLNINEEWK